MDTVDNHPVEFSKILKRQGFLVNVIVTDDQIRVLLEGDTSHVYFQGRDRYFGIQSTKN
jgi:hypothetical protein